MWVRASSLILFGKIYKLPLSQNPCMFISDIVAAIGQYAIVIMSSMGYLGVFFLMVLESIVFPMPSELVMPFAGFLVSQGRFSMFGVFLASTLGSMVGSIASYYAGRIGGNRVVTRYGKYLLLDLEDLKKTERWFAKSGEKTIFIGRLIPVVRHLISIPAGIARMDFKKFLFYTFVGAAIWNMLLAYLGYWLGENWQMVRQYTEPISIAVVIVLALVFAYFVYKHVRDKKATRVS